MHREIVHSTKYIHDLRMHDIAGTARVDADRRDAKTARRLRNSIGHRLIAIGERLVETPSSELGNLDRAA
ncbi:MAG: hypothetical protein U9N56_08235 [Actinomycetota bacterium]|nr:hypothetical protein [Actinomycetota bacterium]